MIEHRNAVNLLHWAGESLEKEAFAHTLASTSLNFDLAVYECFVPLSVGESSGPGQCAAGGAHR